MTHKKLLRTSLGCLLLALSSISAGGQDPSANAAQNLSPEKQALIRELLELTSSKKTIDAMFKAQSDQMDKDHPQMIWEIVSGMKELKSLTAEQREELRLKLVSSSFPGRRMYELLQERIDFHKLIEDISLPLHDKYFTESELKDLVAFYQSTTGRKVVEVLPNLLSETLKQTVDAVMPKLSEMMTQVQEEETERMKKEILAMAKTTEQPAKPPGRTPKRRPRR